jgi:recombination protein RecA
MSRICDRRATQPAAMHRAPGDAERVLKQPLARGQAGSLGSLISLQAEALLRDQSAQAGGVFECTVRALKDKRRGPGWTHTESYRGPPGLH